MAQNPNIDDDTRARARRFVEDAGMPKPAVTANPSVKKAPIVTKKMLEESGFDNLRDYLNAQRGLTRRGESKAAKIDPDALDRNYVRRDMKDRMDVIDRETQGDFLRAARDKPRRTPESLSSTRKPGTNVNYENEDATSESFKKGGSVRGWGMARGARKAKIV